MWEADRRKSLSYEQEFIFERQLHCQGMWECAKEGRQWKYYFFVPRGIFFTRAMLETGLGFVDV
jgi:hypothetical protein